MSKDRLGQEGRDEPVSPKPRSSSRATLILGLNPLNRVRPLPPRMLTRDHGGTGHQVWLPARGGDEEVSSPPEGLKLTSAESAGQRRWGDPDRADIKDNLDETRGYRPDTHAPPGDAVLTCFAQVALKDSSLWWLYWGEIEWTQLNFIIPF